MSSSVTRLAVFGVLLIALLGAGCNKNKDTPQTPPPPKIGVAKPVVVPVQAYYEYNGTLETTKAVDVRARVKGFLTKVYFTEGTEVRGPNPEAKDEDEDQKRGEKLYAIDQREYKTALRKAEAEEAKAAADIGNWKAQIKLASAEVERLTQAGSAASKTEVDKAKATLEVNEAELKSAEAALEGAKAAVHSANIQLGYTDIRAPLTGLISRTHVDEGNLVGQNEATLLTTIVRMDELYVLFDAPERDLVEYQQSMLHQKAPLPSDRAIPVEVGVTSEPGYPHKGKIDFRENRVDPGTGTIRIRGRIPNPLVPPNNVRRLYPGLYARVRVPAGNPVDQPVIPEEALMTGQEGRYVYVVVKEKDKDDIVKDIVKKRTVTVGTQVYRAPPSAPPPPQGKADPGPPPRWALRHATGGDSSTAKTQPPVVRSMVAITKGLDQNDVIVVDGLQRARSGAPVVPELMELIESIPPPAGK